MSESLFVHKWDEWQSYRSDRGAPPWIKVHRKLLTSKKWAVLTDAEKGQLVSIWLIAADNNGVIPNDPRIIRKVCMLDDAPNISRFTELGFIDAVGCQVDATVTPTCQPDDVPDQRRVEESREEEITSVPPCPHQKIVSLYNKKLPVLPSVKEKLWNGTRSKNLQARWAEDDERQDVEWWSGLFDSINDMPFLLGDSGKGWKADLGWIVKKENLVKIVEGRYTKHQQQQKNDYSGGRRIL